MKSSKVLFLGIVALVSGGAFISCTPPIEGELTPLVKFQDYVYEVLLVSPCWSSDGLNVYFTSIWDSLEFTRTYRVWCVDVKTEAMEQISTGNISIVGIDISKEDNLCVTYWGELFHVLDAHTWTELVSLEPQASGVSYSPRFSYESDRVFYYMYEIPSGSTYLRKVNLKDSTDEVILTVKQGGYCDPGPGDTLFAIHDTIYNVKSNKRIPIGIDLPSTGTVNWNPADPSELLISTGVKHELYIFDLETRELTELNVKATNSNTILDAKFSPDGKRIVLATKSIGDAVCYEKIWIFDPVK